VSICVLDDGLHERLRFPPRWDRGGACSFSNTETCHFRAVSAGVRVRTANRMAGRWRRKSVAGSFSCKTLTRGAVRFCRRVRDAFEGARAGDGISRLGVRQAPGCALSRLAGPRCEGYVPIGEVRYGGADGGLCVCMSPRCG
jgi:hypothetical protein